jgi:acetate kinase
MTSLLLPGRLTPSRPGQKNECAKRQYFSFLLFSNVYPVAVLVFLNASRFGRLAEMKVLVINAGSSSVKFTLFEIENETLLAKGMIERIHTAGARLRYENNRGEKVERRVRANSYEAAISQICLALADKATGVIDALSEIEAIGHRVVHGGSHIRESGRINKKIKQIIRDEYTLAPIHNPPNYEGIEACENLFPNAPMVAVFDTAFHQSMEPAAYTYAIPADVAEKHKIRRYGFHGTSHHYVALRAAELLGRDLNELRLITAHLGNGCSITAIRRGQVADTSMGLTPLEGLVMGTRCGDLDPAVVLFLLRRGYTADEVDSMLNKQSGLLGLARMGSSDMRDILTAVDEGHPDARLALDVFIHRLVKYVGAYAAVLNGFDALVFTGGIGERSALVRARVCEQLEHLGITIDPSRNRNDEIRITADENTPCVLVIPTNEELMIARETVRVLNMQS